MPREKTDVEERWQRGDRGIRTEKEVWGCAKRRRRRWRKMERERRAMGERNSRVARTPKLVCHSVRQSAYSQAQTQVQYLRKSEYIYTQNTHFLTLSTQAGCWKYPYLSSVTV